MRDTAFYNDPFYSNASLLCIKRVKTWRRSNFFENCEIALLVLQQSL